MENKKIIMITFILVLLISARVFRYEVITKTPETERYIDRWTGTEWIKVHHETGTNRNLYKYYAPDTQIKFEEAQVLAELQTISNRETFFEALWYISGLVMFYSLYRSRKRKRTLFKGNHS